MKKLVFATNNQHKLDEVRAVVPASIEIISLSELNCFDDIPETATTLEGNALIKAEYIFNKFGLACMADDTGLEVDALDGAPGVYSARYAGEAHDALKNMEKLLAELKDTHNRAAQFRTVITLKTSTETLNFEGVVHGEIAVAPSGKGGFGYDPIFIPAGFTKSFAELGSEQKNKISHRALAVEKLIEYLENNKIE